MDSPHTHIFPASIVDISGSLCYILITLSEVLFLAKTLEYKGHPLQRKDNIIYYGSFADKYIIMLQILDTKNVKDLDVASKVSVQLQLTDPSIKSRDRIVNTVCDRPTIVRIAEGLFSVSGPVTGSNCISAEDIIQLVCCRLQIYPRFRLWSQRISLLWPCL